MKQDAAVTHKQVNDVLVASIRFLGEYDQIPEYFETLYHGAKDEICGNGMVLHHLFNPSGGPGRDLEVCYPIGRPVIAEGIACRTLKGGHVLAAHHEGPISPRGHGGSITDAWHKLFDYVGKESVIVDAVPLREVFLKEGQELEPFTDPATVEVQLGYAFYRLEKLAGNLEQLAGKPVQTEVMAGSDGFQECSYHARATWFKGAMERLDDLVEDQDTRRDIMITAGDRFPRERIAMLRDLYQRTGDLDRLLRIMREDRSLGDRSWYENSSRQGNVIHVTKDPVLPDEYEQAKTKDEKRAAYCHCRVLKDAIQSGITMSSTYCYCGAGWYEQLWSGIMDEAVQLEVLESILQGDDCCTFAIHLPVSDPIPA
jgi:hypothetical protein